MTCNCGKVRYQRIPGFGAISSAPSWLGPHVTLLDLYEYPAFTTAQAQYFLSLMPHPNALYNGLVQRMTDTSPGDFLSHWGIVDPWIQPGPGGSTLAPTVVPPVPVGVDQVNYLYYGILNKKIRLFPSQYYLNAVNTWWNENGNPEINYWSSIAHVAEAFGAAVGASYGISALTGASTGTATAGTSLAPTSVTTGASATTSLAQPVSIGTFAPVSSGGILPISPVGAVAGAGTGGGLLSTLGTATTIGSTVLKGAAALTALKQIGKTGPVIPVQPGTGAPATAKSSSILPLLLLGGAGVGLLFLGHLV